MKKIFTNEFIEFNKVIFKYFLFCFFLFFTSLIITKFIFASNPENVISILDNQASQLALNDTAFNVFGQIFINNLIVCFFTILSGFLPFVFLPVVACIRNAYPVGLILAGFDILKKNVFLIALVTLVPHGIFEIPAVLYSFSIGIHLCLSITTSMVKKVPTKKYIVEIKDAFIFIILPMLLVAAFIEAFVVPYLTNAFLL